MSNNLILFSSIKAIMNSFQNESYSLPSSASTNGALSPFEKGFPRHQEEVPENVQNPSLWGCQTGMPLSQSYNDVFSARFSEMFLRMFVSCRVLYIIKMNSKFIFIATLAKQMNGGT